MVHPQALMKLYGYNVTLINKQTADLSHEESLLQLPFDGNSLNWILGHLVSSRTLPLRLVGQAGVWTEAQRARYRHGSANVTADGEGILRLETLLADLNQSQERLVAGLAGMSYEEMCRPSGYQDNTVGDSLAYFQFHEAHHVGQLMYLAQFAGKPGVWFD
jgi:uncharacterized damage-inducible protein DinB